MSKNVEWSSPRRATVVLLAVALAVAGWALGRVALGHAPLAGDRSVGLAQVAVVTAVVGLLAWGTSTTLPPRPWRLLALGVAALSLLGPLTQAGGGSAAVLVALHVVVAATLVLGLGPARERR